MVVFNSYLNVFLRDIGNYYKKLLAIVKCSDYLLEHKSHDNESV